MDIFGAPPLFCPPQIQIIRHYYYIPILQRKKLSPREVKVNILIASRSQSLDSYPGGGSDPESTGLFTVILSANPNSCGF